MQSLALNFCALSNWRAPGQRLRDYLVAWLSPPGAAASSLG
jgi:hypothetical protein